MEAPRKIEVTTVDALVVFIIVTSGVMMFELVPSRFDPASSVFISLLICGAAGLAFVRRIAFPPDVRHIVAVTLMGLLVLSFRWSPFLYVEGGQDQGVYVAMSAHFARTQGLAITDRVRERLADAEKTDYDKLNNRQIAENIVVPGRSEGEHQPGVFIGDLSRSAYVFQFYPLHPLWMALAAKVLGDENRVYSLVFFSLLSVLMLSLLTFELADRKHAPAFLAAGLLAINPMHVFLSRFPLTENVTLFFSATAFYYLLRYFKARGAATGQAWNLVLSAGAWACLFFTHIGGFLYAPLILAAVVAGIISEGPVSRVAEIIGYGLGVLAAYALSLWYGMTWSFPYSLGTYKGEFGTVLGTLFVDHWKAAIVVFVIAYCGLVYLAARFRARIRSDWTKLRLDGVLMGVLLVTVLATIVYATAQAYRLGYTMDYSLQSDPRNSGSTAFRAAGENWHHGLSQISNTGATGLLHSSLTALAIYVSPFILVFVLAVSVAKRRSIGIYEIFLMMLVTLFLVVRVGISSAGLTLYYYYGRYLAAELVPYILVLAALWSCRLLQGPGWLGKAAASGMIALALAWEGVALVQQYPGGEMHRLDASMRPLVDQIRDNDLLFLLAGGTYPSLRTPLDYYYGKHSVVVEPGQLATAIRQYANLPGDLYILSDTDNLTGFSYLGALPLVQDTYARGRSYDVLPTNASTLERRYFLYRVNRPMFTPLRNGDSITFDARGNAHNYLGTGWSGQESWGRWTEGPLATLQLPISDRSSASTLRFEVHAHNCVSVTVRVNAEIRTRWSFSDCRDYVNQNLVLTPDDLRLGTVTVSFEMSGVISPYDMDPALGDRRKLGISIRKIVVDQTRTMRRPLLSALAPAAARRGLPTPPRCLAPDGPHRPRPFEMSTSESRKNVDGFVHRGSRPDAAACVLGLPCASPHTSRLAQHGQRDYFNPVPGASLWPVLTRPCMAGFEVSTEDAIR